jgi:hypothetical protein
MNANGVERDCLVMSCQGQVVLMVREGHWGGG